MSDEFTTAVSAQVMAATAGRDKLLASLVRTSQAVFRAEASSIALLDGSAGDFVFRVVAGQGADELEGSRFPAREGLGATVAETGEPLIVDDLGRDPRFASDIAQETGHVPRTAMIAPLLGSGRTIGLFYVLDRGETGRAPLDELGLLVAFAGQATQAIAMGEAARQAALLLDGAAGRDEGLAALARIVGRLAEASPAKREAAARLIDALDELLG